MSGLALASDGYASMCLLEDLDIARDRLNRATDLLQWSINLRQQLWWGFDLDLMVDEVAAFKRACVAYRRGS